MQLISNLDFSLYQTFSWKDKLIDASNRYWYWGGKQFVLYPSSEKCILTEGAGLTAKEKAFKVALYAVSFIAAGMFFYPISSGLILFKASLLFIAAIPVLTAAVKIGINLTNLKLYKDLLAQYEHNSPPISAPLCKREEALGLWKQASKYQMRSKLNCKSFFLL